jgi:hypothetical protein
LKLSKWSGAKLAAVAVAIVLAAVAATFALSALILEKTYHVDDERATVFVSFENHSECGAVYDFANPNDLEAGDLVSGDSSPCEYRNLLLQIFQVLVVMAAIGGIIWMLAMWLTGREPDAKSPGPGSRPGDVTG